MNANERKIPQIIEEIEAVINRLPRFHPLIPILEEKKRNYWTGYRGEQKIDFHLGRLEQEKYLIFAGLRLIHQTRAFQMDTLIVTPCFFLIIESKNIAGKLIFEKDSTQVIRELEGKEQGFQNPLIQVAIQKFYLKAWLNKNKIPSVPIEDIVGIADRRTIIETTDDNRQIYKKLIHADMIVDKIRQLEAVHKQELLSHKQLQKIKKLLLKGHTLAQPSILKAYNIADTEIAKGPQCQYCKLFPLKRRAKKWFCEKCKCYSKDAHRQAIFDFFLIKDTKITNKQCREFLLLESANITKKLLARMQLPTTGTTKDRFYHRPQNL